MSQNMRNEHLLKIILAPRVTEKSALIAAQNQYVFKVLDCATKPEIKKAVEMLFNVQVKDVQVSRVKSKRKRVGRIEGTRKGWKKAFVKLADGQKIDLIGA